jgi:hypothetical protein
VVKDALAPGINAAWGRTSEYDALFGAIALHDFNRALDHRLTTQTVSSEVNRATASIVRDALAESIRLAMLLAAAFALAGAVCAALTIAPTAADRIAPPRDRPARP